MLASGTGVHSLTRADRSPALDRYVCIGESLLLGATLLVGELLLLSLFGLYRTVYLWSAVFVNFLFLINKTTRYEFLASLKSLFTFDISSVLFLFLLAVFLFRNCYFMVDVDSHSTYLHAQKLWLSHGTSLFGDKGMDVRIFTPHFDGVPYALGISLFGKETLFPQLVNVLWRIIVLFLVFGYTRYRFNGYYALAAGMFVLFNEHFFYSGVNHWVIINAALIAFLFSAFYNLWEYQRRKDTFRLFLAILFAGQLLANKYQMVYVALFFCLFSLSLCSWKELARVFQNKFYLTAILLSWIFMSLWYVKNWIVTRDPFFPVLAGPLHALGYDPEKWSVFVRIAGGLSLSKILKYLNYLFIWPGMGAAKYAVLTISLLPLMLLYVLRRPGKVDHDKLSELCYWLGASLLTLIGICLANHQDPRYYRYAIGIFSYTAVYSFDYFFVNVLNLYWKPMVDGFLIVLACFGGFNEGAKIIFQENGFFQLPSMKENIAVVRNQIGMSEAVKKHYPLVDIINNTLAADSRASEAAWDVGASNVFPFFLLPDKPTLSLWFTNIVQWSSYEDKSLIKTDLENAGIKWAMKFENDALVFLSADEYAEQAKAFDRYPKKVLYDYDFPSELSSL